jgi:predicted HTH transcriptional regulator
MLSLTVTNATAVTDIELSLFEDRLEVISPGTLPNTVTVEKMARRVRSLPLNRLCR